MPSHTSVTGQPAVLAPAGFECQPLEVPDFSTSVISPRLSKYCVLIPVINEGKRIQAQLAKMCAANLACDVIIVDGGSTDGSLDLALLERYGVRALLVKTGPGKLSAQLRVGFYFALLEGYQGVITIDGNGKDGVEAIPKFVSSLDAGFDHVQGSRYVPGGVALNTPWDRSLGVQLLHAPLISLAAGFRYTDTTNGFRGYSRQFLLDSRVQVFRDAFSAYNLHYYLAIRAPRLGYRVCELPVLRAYPKTGAIPSKISGLQGKVAVLKQMWTAVTGGYNP